MPVKPVRTLGRFVFDGIEERLIVGSPGNTGDSFDALGERFTGAQVPHTKSVLAEAGIVRGVCKQIIVIAHVEGAKPEKTVSFGELVEVQKRLFSCIFPILPAVMIGILLALHRPSEIKIPAQPIGNREISLLDSPQHFLVKLLLKCLSGFQDGVSVGILCLQVCKHFRGLFVAKPVVMVYATVAMKHVVHGFPPSHRGNGR